MRNENGITLLALVITITIMAIVSVTIFFTAKGIDTEVKDDVLLVELETVHHIVLQEWNKKLTLGTYEFKGTKVENLIMHNTNLGNVLETSNNTYYELSSDVLEELGAKNVSSKYLVCYETGEVANISKYKTSDGDILYTK